MIINKARNILLKEKKREKTIDIEIKMKLIITIKYSSKPDIRERPIINNGIYPRYEKDHLADIY